MKADIEAAGKYVIPTSLPANYRDQRRRGVERRNGSGRHAVLLSVSVEPDGTLVSVGIGALPAPVFRDFYKERSVVREERRMRVESEPQGELQESFLAAAFEAHPYRHSPGGWASDIEEPPPG